MKYLDPDKSLADMTDAEITADLKRIAGNDRSIMKSLTLFM
jgi:hypothetical protein